MVVLTVKVDGKSLVFQWQLQVRQESPRHLQARVLYTLLFISSLQDTWNIHSRSGRNDPALPLPVLGKVEP
ncbi:hypothetical protein IC006_0267 [Sulfuracidifex tepidarius]|uniref:Uncharacterized protein n=1 Tax=Sulfuracidifex tepidarius TaxID=1294262 RepID=A0A510DS39_9CREN|nr:hypothetical protein [Sulfuracidifex tepidarius]BBG22983.1 hypothetical protein IC006_0267 [Sulfuracidifex tepidarius]